MEAPGLEFTLAALVLGVVLGGLANWQLRRPVDLRWPVVPWLAVQFVSLAMLLIFGAHLISLLTGHPFGRNVN
jgi:TctA family transporter